MTKESDWWIDVSLQDEESEKKIIKAIETLQFVHTWTIDLLNHHFIVNKKLKPYAKYRKDLNKLIKWEKLWRHTQRYSLERAAEKTFPYYAANIRINRNANLVTVKPDEIREITIRFRKIWRKYLAQRQSITTIYGSIFMQGEWKKILRQQAGEIPIELFPYLWHSVTLRRDGDGWKIKFNHHAADSAYAERAKIELERDFDE